ncbi:hypothetical protein GA0115258_126917 [Streptomyces sp. LamerLS-31b]|nr:hypothetical protein GA0115258_126917 [Streptomyces sp. LamerLS-31b]
MCAPRGWPCWSPIWWGGCSRRRPCRSRGTPGPAPRCSGWWRRWPGPSGGPASRGRTRSASARRASSTRPRVICATPRGCPRGTAACPPPSRNGCPGPVSRWRTRPTSPPSPNSARAPPATATPSSSSGSAMAPARRSSSTAPSAAAPPAAPAKSASSRSRAPPPSPPRRTARAASTPWRARRPWCPWERNTACRHLRRRTGRGRRGWFGERWSGCSRRGSLRGLEGRGKSRARGSGRGEEARWPSAVGETVGAAGEH